MTVASTTRYLALHVITCERRLHQRRLAVKHPNIDTRSLCVLHSLVEGGDDAYSGEKRGAEIAKAGPDAGRRTVRPSRQAHHTPHGLHNHVVSGQITEWSGMTKS